MTSLLNIDYSLILPTGRDRFLTVIFYSVCFPFYRRGDLEAGKENIEELQFIILSVASTLLQQASEIVAKASVMLCGRNRIIREGEATLLAVFCLFCFFAHYSIYLLAPVSMSD